MISVTFVHMGWVSSLSVPIICMVLVFLIWDLLLAMIGRLIGIDLPLTRFWRAKKTLARLSDGQYVIYGVIGWGWSMLFAFLLAPYIAHWFFAEPMIPWTAAKIRLEFLIWSGAGLLFGFMVRLREVFSK